MNQWKNFVYLSTGPCNLIDNVGKYDILIICVHTNFLPLDILSQADIVPVKGMRHTFCIRGLPITKYYAGCYFLPHPISWCLIKGYTIFIALRRKDTIVIKPKMTKTSMSNSPSIYDRFASVRSMFLAEMQVLKAIRCTKDSYCLLVIVSARFVRTHVAKKVAFLVMLTSSLLPTYLPQEMMTLDHTNCPLDLLSVFDDPIFLTCLQR